jgi:GDP-L-fucose synthase
MKKLLILGASGFVGRNLAERLFDKYELCAPSSQELDVLDEIAVSRYIKAYSFDIILNALDRKMDISMNNSDSRYVVDRLRMFQNVARLHDYYGKMLYFGTGAEYGRTLPIEKISEDQFGRVIPQDSYGFLMYTMQMLAYQYKNITNFRLFGIFGPYEQYKSRFISNAICKALCGYPITIRQNAVFDYLHTDDLCKMVEHYIENDMTHLSYNATSGENIELLELARLVQRLVNRDVPIFVAKEGYKNAYTSSNDLILKETKVLIGSMIDHIVNLASFYRTHMDQLDKEALLYN